MRKSSFVVYCFINRCLRITLLKIMKIEIILSNNINEQPCSRDCFTVYSDYIQDELRKHYSTPVMGIVIIDDIAVKFYYSPMGADGRIYSFNDNHRSIVKSIVPLYLYNMIDY